MEDGVWRTIGGRRVFIKHGQSLSDAMKESGKFKKGKHSLLDDEDHNRTEIAKEMHKAERKYDRLKKLEDLHKDDEQYKKDLEEARKEYSDLKKEVDKMDNERNQLKEKYMNIPEEERVKAYEEGKNWKDFVKERESKLNEDEVTTKAQWKEDYGNNIEELERDLKNSEMYLDEDSEGYAEAKKSLENGKEYLNELKQKQKSSNDDYKDKFYNKLSDEQKKIVDNAYKEGKKQYEEEKRIGEEYGKSLRSNKEPKFYFEGKKDIEDEARQIYAEEGIRATSDANVAYFAEKYGIPKTQAKQFLEETGKRFDEENAQRNKYISYYKKEGLGEPSNYKKGDKVVYKDTYGENVEATIEREATEKEKEFVMNTNLKGYYVKDKNGSEHLIADTRIKENGKTKLETKQQSMNDKIRNEVAKKEKSSTKYEPIKETWNKGMSSEFQKTVGYKSDVATITQEVEPSYGSGYYGGTHKYWYVKEIADLEGTRTAGEFKTLKDAKQAVEEYRDRLAKPSMNDKIRNEAYKKYKKEHPGSKMTLKEFLKK